MNVLFLYECFVKKEDMVQNVKYIILKNFVFCCFVLVYYVILLSIVLMVLSIYILIGVKNYYNGRVVIFVVMRGIYVLFER